MEHEVPDGYIRLGRLGKTFGLEGGLRFRAEGEAEAQALRSLTAVFIAGLGERPIERLRMLSGQPVLYLAGVGSVDTAKGLVNQEVFAPESALPEPEEGQFYLDALIGLAVFVDGEPFGEVVDIIEAGAQDLLVVEHDEREHLVPLQADYVAVKGDEVRISHPPEGLFSLDRPA